MAADVPDGTVIGQVTLKSIPNVSWSTYILNEMHMQIKFILEESGFLDLQRKGFNWMLQPLQWEGLSDCTASLRPIPNW